VNELVDDVDDGSEVGEEGFVATEWFRAFVDKELV